TASPAQDSHRAMTSGTTLPPTTAATFDVQAQADAARVTLHGAWQLHQALPTASELIAGTGTCKRWIFEPGENFTWDSTCVSRLFLCARHCEKHDIQLDLSALPTGITKLISVATAVPAQVPTAARAQTFSNTCAPVSVASAITSATSSASSAASYWRC